ncbi:MAG TPA: GNAT family protein [Thermomicrobiales bacterium]|nr:GNAT family protein [Thermomicrobiales bacterium]
MEDVQPVDIDIIIRGEQVGLGPIRGDLVTTYQRWMNDLQVTRTLGAPSRPMTVERERQWADIALVSTDPMFTIYTLEEMRPIGNTSLFDFDTDNASCYFGILIGERDAWGKGYGTETTRLMLAYAFDVLGLQNVALTAHADNHGGIRAYERAGFRKIGVRRNAIRVGRHRIDEILMDATPDDIEPSFLDRIMHPGDRA